MKLTYEDCKELKDAGFPQKTLGITKSPGCRHYGTDEWVKSPNYCGCFVHQPSLSELIEACGHEFDNLSHGYYEENDHIDGWHALALEKGTLSNYLHGYGSSPEQAVKNLWIALNKTQV